MQIEWINDDPQSNSYYKICRIFSGEEQSLKPDIRLSTHTCV